MTIVSNVKGYINGENWGVVEKLEPQLIVSPSEISVNAGNSASAITSLENIPSGWIAGSYQVTGLDFANYLGGDVILLFPMEDQLGDYTGIVSIGMTYPEGGEIKTKTLSTTLVVHVI